MLNHQDLFDSKWPFSNHLPWPVQDALPVRICWLQDQLLTASFPRHPLLFCGYERAWAWDGNGLHQQGVCPSSKGFIFWAKKKPVFYETIAGFPARVKFQETISCKVSSKKVR